MQIREVSLADMLAAREQRVLRQKHFLEVYRAPLVSFSMNIAGPVKNTPLIRRGFFEGLSTVKSHIGSMGYTLLAEEITDSHTGCEALLAVTADPVKLKKLCTDTEDRHPAGRLFDIDIITEEGIKLDRTALGYPPRTCLVCGKDAKECASRRLHTVPELFEASERILHAFFREQEASLTASLAQKSLMYEVLVTPKPGLVDRMGSGSHSDMDIFTFASSAASLYSYFKTCALAGIDHGPSAPGTCFSAIKYPGLQAEKAMFEATGGINTHKGAIFSLGILCAACGMARRDAWNDTGLLLELCSSLGSCGLDYHADDPGRKTTGQRLYVSDSITGIRGQAAAGFPVAGRLGLPVLKKALAAGRSLEEAGRICLLHMIAAPYLMEDAGDNRLRYIDTNLIARSDCKKALEAAKRVAKLLSENEFPDEEQISELDRVFTRDNLSPGGSADMLSMTFMLYLLEESSGGT